MNTYEEVKALGCALKQNRSLEKVDIELSPITHNIDLLKQILSCHLTVKQYRVTDMYDNASVYHTSDDDDDDMKLAMARSQSMAALEYKEEETHASPQMNDTSGDDDLELALAMSLSLKTAEEEDRKRAEEKEKEDIEHALRLSLDNN